VHFHEQCSDNSAENRGQRGRSSKPVGRKHR
jgi:hypothetical protein